MESNKGKGKKAKLWWVTILIVILLGVFFGFGYAIGANKIVDIFNDTVKKEMNNNSNEIAPEETTEEEKSTENVQAPANNISEKYKTCEGVYTGTGGISKDISGAVTKGEIKLTLKNDGTFTIERPSMNYLLPEEGNYVILGNSLIFMELKETTGPEDLDPAYAAKTVVIRGDCESIYVPDGWFTEGEITFTK